MDLEDITLSEISQREKDIYVESKKQKKGTNTTEQKQSHRNREQTGTVFREEGWGEWVTQVREIKRYRLALMK